MTIWVFYAQRWSKMKNWELKVSGGRSVEGKYDERFKFDDPLRQRTNPPEICDAMDANLCLLVQNEKHW